MTPAQIKTLRRALDENTTVFAKRFHRSHRTIESWEQGKRRPDALIQDHLAQLAERVDGHAPPRKPRP